MIIDILCGISKSLLASFGTVIIEKLCSESQNGISEDLIKVLKFSGEEYIYTYIHTYIHTYTLFLLPKWAFQLNRIKNTNLYKLIKNVSTIIL